MMLSKTGHVMVAFDEIQKNAGGIKRGRRDSNPQPPDYLTGDRHRGKVWLRPRGIWLSVSQSQFCVGCLFWMLAVVLIIFGST